MTIELSPSTADVVFPVTTTPSEIPETLFFPPEPWESVGMAILCGVAGGLLRDLCGTLLRRFFGKNARCDAVCDLLFVCFTYAALFVCALNTGHGILRWYCYVAALGGFFAYRKTISRPFCRTIEGLCNGVAFVLSRVLHLLYAPIALLFERLQKHTEKRRERRRKRRAEKRYSTEKRRIGREAARGFGLFPNEKPTSRTGSKIATNR